MRKRLTALAAVSALALTACGGAEDTPGDTSKGAAPAAADERSVHDVLGSCEQIESAVAPYIEELVLMPDSTVDEEFGASCGWGTAEGETNIENVRSVVVGALDNEPGTTKPDTSMLEEMEGFTLLEDPWVQEQGGIAYSANFGPAAVGVITTKVWLPAYDIHITGGDWAGVPALDGPAAVAVAKQLFG